MKIPGELYPLTSFSYFCAIHVSFEPTGSRPAQPEQVSDGKDCNVDALCVENVAANESWINVFSVCSQGASHIGKDEICGRLDIRVTL